jgi:hypothetical protein
VSVPVLTADAQLRAVIVPGQTPPVVQIAVPLHIVITCPWVPPAGKPLAAEFEVLEEF